MWLEAGPTNKDPKVVCGYYAKCVQNIDGKFHLSVINDSYILHKNAQHTVFASELCPH